ncbi:ABC transporter substrate-binding protein [Limobrevibacterium gyesilva]|uniref:ABC transporter substrate-binding protein n=1 Tax=Limobrevibacterium gyesilva TaxID=2991712 RepID=A0AA41YRG3_9PROT|nr:ABC transporter substrate-binding protein [Limobrevibacterium gyesilva]MCW3477480.1 ABC transporter substrate-binding protein [Limobrevibacterium gyesilva]
MRRRRSFAAGAAATILTSAGIHRAPAQPVRKVLRVVPQAEPQSFDPVFAQVNNTSMHGAMIYDQLFGWDDKMNVRPQMVDTWSTSDDKLLYTFTLRRGLMFHDGTPVTTRDVIASLKRMFVRDTQNQIFANLIDGYERIDDGTFTLRLKQPFAFTEFLLGGSNGVVGAIMREKDALTDPLTPVRDRIGSGPFRFVEAEYRPGAKLVYEKFDGYVPRSEPASGFAGGKVAKVDRVEWIIIPDPSVAFTALRRGEVDMLDAPPLDLLTTVEHDPNIVIGEVWPLESYAVLRFNSLWPPFSNVRARQAVAHAMNQVDYMSAAYGDAKNWRECYAFWVCGSPNGTEVGSEAFRKPDLNLARRLVRESGYAGTPVVLIGGSDIPAYQRLSLVTVDLLQKIGFKVDLQLSDWGSVATRRQKKDAPAQGGWNLFHTSANGAQLSSPLTSPSTITTCDGKNFYGWPCDQPEEDMRLRYIREPDPATRMALLQDMHRRLWEVVPYIPLGQFIQPFLWRSNISGVLKSNVLAFWNISKA